MTILAICVELINGGKKSLFVAVILSMMLATIKLSGVVFAIMVIIFAVYRLFIKKPEFIKTLLFFASTGFILLAPYIIRNIILTGWPLFPLPVLGLRVPWAVPYDEVVRYFEIVRSWSIHPGTNFRDVMGLSFVQWFPGWVSLYLTAIEFKIFLLTIIFFTVLTIFKFVDKKTIRQNLGLAFCGMTGFASILYLIFSAPDLRFGAVYFWVFFASVGSFFFVWLFKKYPNLQKLLIIFFIFFAIFAYWPPRLDSKVMLRSVRWDQSMSKGKVLITPKDGSPTFEVYTTKDDGNCGTSELPCTSVVNNDFKEIVPGDISKGFAPVK
jgi:hypothetical protein